MSVSLRKAGRPGGVILPLLRRPETDARVRRPPKGVPQRPLDLVGLVRVDAVGQVTESRPPVVLDIVQVNEAEVVARLVEPPVDTVAPAGVTGVVLVTRPVSRPVDGLRRPVDVFRLLGHAFRRVQVSPAVLDEVALAVAASRDNDGHALDVLGPVGLPQTTKRDSPAANVATRLVLVLPRLGLAPPLGHDEVGRQVKTVGLVARPVVTVVAPGRPTGLVAALANDVDARVEATVGVPVGDVPPVPRVASKARPVAPVALVAGTLAPPTVAVAGRRLVTPAGDVLAVVAGQPHKDAVGLAVTMEVAVTALEVVVAQDDVLLVVRPIVDTALVVAAVPPRKVAVLAVAGTPHAT